MGHELSAFYDCAHGTSLAIMMPAWMEYVMSHDVMRFARFAVNVMGCEMDCSNPEHTAREGIAKLRAIWSSWGLPTSFAEINAKAEDIPAMVAHRAERPNGFPFGNFVKIGPDEMTAVMQIAANR